MDGLWFLSKLAPASSLLIKPPRSTSSKEEGCDAPPLLAIAFFGANDACKPPHPKVCPT